MKQLSFFFNNQMIYVNYVVTTNKNMYLRIKKDNQLEVSAHSKVPEEDVRAFVEANLKRFVKFINKSKENALYSFADKTIYINGHKYPVQFITGVLKPECRISGKTFYILTKDGTEAENEKAVNDYIKSNLYDYIAERQIHFETLMEVKPHDVKVVHKTTTWGTNNLRTRSISYSSKLMHFNKKVIDYVIIHELAHYYVHGHDESFWRVVERYMPNYKEYKKELKNNASLTEE